jgi:hypothetical protein
MPDTPTPIFPHRQNTDGTFDAICPGCFLTVVHGAPPDALTVFEKKHVCECALLAERGMFFAQVADESVTRKPAEREPGRSRRDLRKTG